MIASWAHHQQSGGLIYNSMKFMMWKSALCLNSGQSMRQTGHLNQHLTLENKLMGPSSSLLHPQVTWTTGAGTTSSSSGGTMTTGPSSLLLHQGAWTTSGTRTTLSSFDGIATTEPSSSLLPHGAWTASWTRRTSSSSGGSVTKGLSSSLLPQGAWTAYRTGTSSSPTWIRFVSGECNASECACVVELPAFCKTMSSSKNPINL
jgi:hypothetical protein